MSSFRYLIAFIAIVCIGHNLQAQFSDFYEIKLTKADSIAALYARHTITDLKGLSHKLTASLPADVEKFRAIYRWVCNNIDNDYSFYTKNKRMREKLKDSPEELKDWNRKFHPKVFEKLVKEHKTVCTGYAYLVKELAYYANIECHIVDGYGRTAQANIGGEGIPNHSWNAVKLRDKWYLCDPTWSSGSINVQQSSYVKQFSEAYFLASPSLFVLNHYPLDTKWILLDETPDLIDFLNNPLVYKGALHHKVIPEIPSTFNVIAKKGEMHTFRFTTVEATLQAKVELQINRSSSSVSEYPQVYQGANGLYCIDHMFNSKGVFDVHLLLDNQYVSTYSVKVIK